MAPLLRIISSDTRSDNDSALASLADFMGITASFTSFAGIAAESQYPKTGEFHLAVSGDTLAAMQDEQLAEFRAFVTRDVSSLFIYGTDSSPHIVNAVGRLSSGMITGIDTPENAEHKYEITNETQEICGELSGLVIGPVTSGADHVLRMAGRMKTVVSIEGQPFLATVAMGAATVFLVASSKIIDVRERLETELDITKIFSTLFPSAIYLRSVFRDACWHREKAMACLIVDDPLLRNRYGFLDYKELIEAMDTSNFTTCIGFIPWNYRRTDNRISRLFAARPDRLSLCVHGCDHTKSEFGMQDDDRLNHVIRTATARMNSHKNMTGLSFDNAMVFPQGVFSTHAMRMLKRNGYLGAVNAEAFPVDIAHPLEIRDFLQPAITAYSAFPLFLRRYPDQVTEMALDLFWGRPILIIAHHDFFKGNCKHAIDAIERLGAIRGAIKWGSLAEVLRSSYLRKRESGDTVSVRGYSSETILNNDESIPINYLFRKKESFPLPARALLANGHETEYTLAEDDLLVSLKLHPGEQQFIKIAYPEQQLSPRNGISLRREVRTRTRRYLSEMRDNYISRNDFLLAFAVKVKNALLP